MPLVLIVFMTACNADIMMAPAGADGALPDGSPSALPDGGATSDGGEAGTPDGATDGDAAAGDAGAGDDAGVGDAGGGDAGMSTDPCSVPGSSTYDVTSYGADGSDSTADTDGIHAAIAAAAAAGGGRVLFPPGTYMTGGLSISGANDVTLCGVDATLKLTSGSSLLVVRSSSNLSMHGLTLDGSSLGSVAYLVDVQDSPHLVVDDCVVRNVGDGSRSPVGGLVLTPGSDHALVTGSTFENIRSAAVTRAVWVSNYRNTSVAIQGLRVLDSHFENILPAADGDAIVWDQGSKYADGLAQNNTFHNIGKRAVKSMGNGTVIRCNTITRSLGGYSYSAISVYGDDHLIENNHITTSGTSAYNYVFDLNGSTIRAINNHVSLSTGASLSISRAVFFSGTSAPHDIAVENNDFSNLGAVLQFYTAPTNVNVAGNTTCASGGFYVGTPGTPTRMASNTYCGAAAPTRADTFTDFTVLAAPNPTCP